jgi:hypothetical protein
MSEDRGTSTQRYNGGCHCGAVRFQADLDLSKPATRCNCSICTKIAQTGVLVKPAAFQLLAGEDHLGDYVWGAKIGTRRFCKHCGVHCYGQGHLKEIGGDYVSVNLNTLDTLDVSELEVVYWDGRHDNWMVGPRPTPWPLVVAPTIAHVDARA